MKRFTFYLIYYFIPVVVYSQTIKVLYTEQILLPKEVLEVLSQEEQRKLLLNTENENYILLFSQNKSVYYPDNEKEFEKKLDSDIVFSQKKSLNNNKIGITESIIYKNLDKGLFRWELKFLSVNYNIKDILPKYKWEVINETRNIQNFICKKAIAVSNGNYITAWYVPMSGINAGPDKYHGLPGLILELKTEKKIIRAIKIAELTENTNIVLANKKTNFISLANFYKLAYQAKCIECEEKRKTN